MARRSSGGGGGGSSGGMMAPILSIATGLLVFVILEIFAPTIAGTIEDAQPEFGTTCSYVNTSTSVTHYGACGTANASAGLSYTTAYSQDAMWNPDYNGDLPDGSDEWTTNIRILGVVILIISISVGMYYLKSM